jgi:hypothetical protein
MTTDPMMVMWTVVIALAASVMFYRNAWRLGTLQSLGILTLAGLSVLAEFLWTNNGKAGFAAATILVAVVYLVYRKKTGKSIS